MAHVEVSQLSKQEKDELAVAYAALLLHDDGIEITVSCFISHLYRVLTHFMQGEKLSKVLKASGNDVEAFWPSMFAKALKGQNIDELLSAISSAPAVAAAPSGAAPAQAAAPVKEESILFNMSS